MNDTGMLKKCLAGYTCDIISMNISENNGISNKL